MIGNDVVDILQSRRESNWQRPGFLQKIFTPYEQQLITTAPDPEVMVWLLWSMKEAAYKIYNRQTKMRVYIPKQLVCSLSLKNSSYCTGQVICFGTIYNTKTIISHDSIYSVAVTHLKDLNKIVEIDRKETTKDAYGFPWLLTGKKNQLHYASVTHHGRFEKVAAICL